MGGGSYPIYHSIEQSLFFIKVFIIPLSLLAQAQWKLEKQNYYIGAIKKMPLTILAWCRALKQVHSNPFVHYTFQKLNLSHTCDKDHAKQVFLKKCGAAGKSNFFVPPASNMFPSKWICKVETGEMTVPLKGDGGVKLPHCCFTDSWRDLF